MLQAIFPEKNKKSFLEKLEKSKNLRYHVHQSNLLSTSNLSRNILQKLMHKGSILRRSFGITLLC